MIKQYVTALNEDTQETLAFDTHRTTNPLHRNPLHHQVFQETAHFTCEAVWREALDKLAFIVVV